jgi:hypothetical protein
MFLDPFKDGFTLAQLSQSINILPNMYGRVNELGLFTWRPQSTPTIVLEMQNNSLALVPTIPWGGVAPKNNVGKRNIRSFVVPQTALEDMVKAADLVGIRSFGQENAVDPVVAKVNEKLQTVKNKFDITMEFRKIKALQGVVYDADGSSVIYDYFAEFGITKKTVGFDFATLATSTRLKCLAVSRHIEDNLLGETMQRVHALSSPEFFDALIEKADVKAVFANHQAAVEKNGGDPRKGFSYGGITFEEYRGTVGTLRFIDAGKAIAFPVGTFETFSNFGAPADFVETVNTIALPMYMKQKNTDFDRGIEMHGQANQLPLVTRPNTIVELTMTA